MAPPRLGWSVGRPPQSLITHARAADEQIGATRLWLSGRASAYAHMVYKSAGANLPRKRQSRNSQLTRALPQNGRSTAAPTVASPPSLNIRRSSHRLISASMRQGAEEDAWQAMLKQPKAIELVSSRELKLLGESRGSAPLQMLITYPPPPPFATLGTIRGPR